MVKIVLISQKFHRLLKAMVLSQNAVFELSTPVLVSTKAEVLALYCDS